MLRKKLGIQTNVQKIAVPWFAISWRFASRWWFIAFNYGIW